MFIFVRFMPIRRVSKRSQEVIYIYITRHLHLFIQRGWQYCTGYRSHRGGTYRRVRALFGTISAAYFRWQMQQYRHNLNVSATATPISSSVKLTTLYLDLPEHDRRRSTVVPLNRTSKEGHMCTCNISYQWGVTREF